jgi:HK97 family phage major capsid protein
MKQIKALRQQMGAAHDKMKALTDAAKNENRKLTDDELQAHSDAYEEARSLADQIQLLEREGEIETVANSTPGSQFLLVQPREKNETESRNVLMSQTARLFSAAMNVTNYKERMETIQDAQAKLTEAGHYPKGAADEGFNTLVDTDGGIFLPTTVTDEVLRLAREFGVFGRFAMQFPLGEGKKKVPNIMGGLKFYAVNEGSDIKVSKFTFRGLELAENKWALVIPWTNEIDSKRGAQLAQLIIVELAQAFAALLDDVVINADGTATYHNIKGLTVRANDAQADWVRKSSAASGNDSFAKIKGSDWNNARKDVAPSLISRGIYVAHPHRQIELMNLLTDPSNANESKFITVEGDQMFIFGRPIYFTEAFPTTDGANVPYAAYVAPGHIAYGTDGGFITDLLTESTLLTDGGDEVRLGSQDMKALRVKTHMDVEFSPVTVDDNGTKKGSFAVLYTAA